jgi:hypothetical protein
VIIAGVAAWPFCVVLAQGPAMAQSPPSPPACAAANSGLPAALAAWIKTTDLDSATSANSLSQARLAPGGAVRLRLSPTMNVGFLIAPEKAPAPGSQGGLLTVSVRKAATYRIALSAGAWIDVVKDGQSQTATAHGHGPACTSIRKMVDFALTPGDYVIQISGAEAAILDMLVTEVP